MNDINYDVLQNKHTLTGATAALKVLLNFKHQVGSLLDVGCGPGSWLRAAIDLGVPEVQGIEGRIPAKELLFCDEKHIQSVNLTSDWALSRKFDVVLCLEVAEHLPEESARSLIQKLCMHADDVIFSAALPGQPGQHHINCQWPVYWQQLFNREGFVCIDDLRWKIWEEDGVEPWYRQNVFRAVKNVSLAGSESRIPSVIHPEMAEGMVWQAMQNASERHRALIEQGSEAMSWYPITVFKAAWMKVRRHFLSKHID